MRFLKNKRGSSSVEAAIILGPILILFFIFMTYFNKGMLMQDTDYYLKEAITSAIKQPTFDKAKQAATDSFNLGLEIGSEDQIKLRTDESNPIEFEIRNLEGDIVEARNHWCKDYMLTMRVKVDRKSPFLTLNSIRDDLSGDVIYSVDNSMKLNKTIFAKIENAKVCD